MTMSELEKQLIMDYMIYGNNIGKTDVFVAIELLTSMDGGDIINFILENKEYLRPIVTGEIPQFSNEKDIYGVLRVLIDSGLSNLTYEQIGEYICSIDAKFDARRKYGETHYKFAYQLGFTTSGYPLSATEIGVAYYYLENDEKRQALMNRLVFSIPFVQHAIIKAASGHFYMPEFLGEYLSPSTVVRRRSNMHKIMMWAYDITEGRQKQLFDNIAWY